MAEESETPPKKAPPQPTDIVGKPIDRTDGRLKVTGGARYAADFPVKDVAHGVAFQSVIAKGRVKSIDTALAEKMPGVIAILTHKNAQKLFPVSNEHNPGKPGQTYLPLQDDRVRYAGQYLGVVVAETLDQARHAAERVKVAYEEEKPVVYLEEALGSSFAPKKMGRGEKPDSSRGDADKALAAAAKDAGKIQETYTTPIENHNPMEMSATIAAWGGATDGGAATGADHLTIYNATQWVMGARAVVATWLGMPDEQVRVTDPFVGGGFGCKGSIWPHEFLAPLAAKLAGRPVKLVLTRQQMFMCIGYRPKTIQRVGLSAGKDGKLTGIAHDSTSQTSEWKDEWVETAAKQTRMLYSCPNVRTSHRLAAVNANTPTQMRAPGHATGTFALEVAMDELATQLAVDPVELRLRNYAEKDEDEKKPFSSKALKECYQQGAERFGWAKRNPKPRSVREGNLLIGMGMATATYPTNRQEAKVKVKLFADAAGGGVRAVVSSATHDLGTGTYTIMSQIAAETLGLPIEQVKFVLGDSTLPDSPVSGGSQTAASVGSAVKEACMKTVANLKERAVADLGSPLHGREEKEMAVGAGRIFLKGNPATGESIGDLIGRNGGRPIEAETTSAPPGAAPTEDAGDAKPKEEYSKHAWGAQFAEVRVDERLGEVRVSRFVGAFAAGRILNPKTARSQVLGGIVWGISMALHEATEYDPNRGKVVNDNLADYLVPVNADIPPIDCFFVEEHDEHVNPLGVKGVGELGVTGAAAAVANAVYNATGKRLRDLPIRLDQLL